MLIARGPLRISFAGGGTDLKACYQDHGGLIVSTSIDKYVYVVANVNGSESAQITSSNYQTFFRQRRGQPIRWDGDLRLPRAFLHHFGVDGGVSLSRLGGSSRNRSWLVERGGAVVLLDALPRIRLNRDSNTS